MVHVPNTITSGAALGATLERGALTAAATAVVWAVLVLGALGVEARTRGRVRLALALGCPHRVHRRLLGPARAESRAPVSLGVTCEAQADKS
jgi:hypothetical protein